MSFKDHFSAVSAAYAEFRPLYPRALYDYLLSLVPGRDLAWDCGTGNGQVAVALARDFSRVVGTDPSRSQIEYATAHPRVNYHVARSTVPDLADGGVDLVTAAQALHWFDHAAFYREVRRVLRPGGVMAAWCYSRVHVNPEVDRVMARYYEEVVGPFWPPERGLVEAGYGTLPFPFDEIRETPPLVMEAPMDLAHFTGYLGTWSSSQRYRAARGADPVDAVRQELAAAWGSSTQSPPASLTVTWPLHLRVGFQARVRT